jgi:hypothetical protein
MFKNMGVATAFEIAKYLYVNYLRSILKEAVNDPEKKWDDVLMKVTDGIFGYDE